MWVDAHTDLGDFYRDRLTLRQIWVRIKALPNEAHLRQVMYAEAEREKTRAKEREISDTLAKFQPPEWRLTHG